MDLRVRADTGEDEPHWVPATLLSGRSALGTVKVQFVQDGYRVDRILRAARVDGLTQEAQRLLAAPAQTLTADVDALLRLPSERRARAVRTWTLEDLAQMHAYVLSEIVRLQAMPWRGPRAKGLLLARQAESTWLRKHMAELRRQAAAAAAGISDSDRKDPQALLSRVVGVLKQNHLYGQLTADEKSVLETARGYLEHYAQVRIAAP